MESSTTSQALETLSLGSAPGAVGVQLLHAITTASARSHLAITAAGSAGAVGAAIFEAGTSASVKAAFGLVSAGDMETTGVAASTYSTPANLVVNAQGLITGVDNTGGGGLTLGTEQATTSGTSKNFGSIPSGTKLIIMSLVGVSAGASMGLSVTIGDSGGIETTGYTSVSADSGAVLTTSTSSFKLTKDASNDGDTIHGFIALVLEDSTDFTWTAIGVFYKTTTTLAYYVTGSKSLSAELTQVQLNLDSGTAFDAGAVNIAYM